MTKTITFLLLFTMMIIGCTTPEDKTSDNNKLPSFVVVSSEYPSWSTLFVADMIGEINGKEGEYGPLERKWNVDLVLKEVDYDTCLAMYGNNAADASCHTNIDALAPSQGRKSVVVCPNSTSVGADACITVGIDSIEDLKGVNTYGLEFSVAHFAFVSNLKSKGYDPKEFPFKNMDPAAASTAMIQNQEGISSIQVWNPFVNEVLSSNDKSKNLFNTTDIPYQVIDCIVVGADVLEKEGGFDFACCLADTYYVVCEKLGPALGEDQLTEEQAEELVSNLTEEQAGLLEALGSKFSNLNASQMARCVRQTRFLDIDSAIALFHGNDFMNKTTPYVTETCIEIGMIDSAPTIEFVKYEDSNADLVYDSQFMEVVKKNRD